MPLTHVWWQRAIVTTLALILAFGFPASVGVRGPITLIFAGLLCYFPAAVLAMILVFKSIQPKYVERPNAVTTLFQR
jgi:hypothetical protein